MTEAMKEYKREWNRRLREAHLCRDCKKQDGHTLGGFVLCWDCAEKANARQSEYRKSPEFLKQKRAYVKKRYSERKKDGVCPKCGRKRQNKQFVLCERCRWVQRENIRAKTARESDANYPRGANGFCWRCNKKPSMPGKHTCPECYEVYLAAIKHANSFRKKNTGFKKITYGKGASYTWNVGRL